jgi:lysophospholipase L1-like esterase
MVEGMTKKAAHKGAALMAAAGMAGLLLAGCVSGGEAVQTPPPTPSVTATQAVQSPTPSATQAVTAAPGAVPESAAVEDSYFDDAVFIGDSVSLKLKNYVVKKRASDPGFLGKAQFLVSGSLGSGNALWEVSDKSVHPTINGQKLPLEESVALTGAKKVYIMLGINDVVPYGIDGSVDNMETVIEKIRAKSPGIMVYVQSATPITRGGEKVKLTNKTLNAYNARLAELCKDRGYYYIDVAAALKDSAGYLPDAYSSDNYVHFTDEACEIWINYLRTHTA